MLIRNETSQTLRILNKNKQKFASGKVRTLSTTGKVVFIKSNLLGDPQYTMNWFKIPKIYPQKK